SRRARGLPFWFSLAAHGSDAYRDAIESTLAVAREGAREIRDRSYLELLVEPDLSALIFRRIGWSAADHEAGRAGLLARGSACAGTDCARGREEVRRVIGRRRREDPQRGAAAGGGP